MSFCGNHVSQLQDSWFVILSSIVSGIVGNCQGQLSDLQELPDSSRDALDNFAQVRLAEMHLHMEREMHDSQGA